MQFTTAFIITAIAGLSLAAPVIEERYVGGACGIHVTQYQKNELGIGSEYEFDVQIKDAVGAILGGTNHQAVADRSSAYITSELPYGLILTTGSVDSDPITFAYAGQTWSSSSGCSTGAYSGGNRDMDCGFTC
ncbi:hypothetical protein F4677DRAFT_427844 [Hypoxylon crocopeplum]|nr:hypothetical protein F4677DRAFT_427844 [Hypoxylon crocopeplum]